MRSRERYLISTQKHPGYQIEDIGKTSNQKTEILTEMLRKKCLNHVRQSVITYITILVYHREIADKMKRERVFKKTDFAWQLSFKFDILNIPDIIDKLHEFEGQQIDLENEKVQSKIMTKLVEVEFDVLQYKKDYGFEYIGNQQRLVITPLTERCQRALLVALQYSYGGAPEGPFGTGKTETTKDLARHLAKLCYVQNSSGQIEYENMVRFFKGISSAGAWVVFDEFNRLDPKILTFLSQIII